MFRSGMSNSFTLLQFVCLKLSTHNLHSTQMNRIPKLSAIEAEKAVPLKSEEGIVTHSSKHSTPDRQCSVINMINYRYFHAHERN
jgi:hypothetical protein